MLKNAKNAAAHNHFVIEHTISDADPKIASNLAAPKFKAVLAELKQKGKVYDVLGKYNLHIFDRHHMLKNIFWSMHDAWLIFNIKEGTIEYQYVIDLAVMRNALIKLIN